MKLDGNYGHQYSWEYRSIRQLQSFCEKLLDRIEKIEHRIQRELYDLSIENGELQKRIIKLESKV
jgi:hypothetical protein